MKFLISSVCLLLLVMGCGPQQLGRNPLHLTADQTIELPAFTAIGETVEAVQVMEGAYRDHKWLLQVRVSASSEHVHILALDAMGRRAFEIIWSAESYQASQASWVPQQLDPKQVLLDVLLVYLSEQDLSVLFAKHPGLSVQGEDGRRRVLYQGEPILEVSYDQESSDRWQGKATVTHQAFGYRLIIQSRRL